MSAKHRQPRRAPRRRRVHRTRTLVVLAAAIAVFVLGIVIGETVHESGGDGSVTYDRTVRIPPERQTVTVTVTSG